jgi:translation initiation factor IF-2
MLMFMLVSFLPHPRFSHFPFCGCMVFLSKANLGCFAGTISSLKSHKKDVEEMRMNTECGISFEGWEEFKVGDRIQCYEERLEKRTL